ncbi:MAG: hypothetical protein AAF593_04620 [Planctomycetota bacterium]
MSSQHFPTTIWSLVREADHERTVVRTAALDQLLRQYAPAMVSHLARRKRLLPEHAEDIVQGFIVEKVLEKGLVGKADANRGKFRTLLLTALDRYLASDFRAASAQKRGGGRVSSLEGLGAPIADASSGGGGDAFEVEWSRTLMDQAIDRMKQECDTSDRPDVWGVFHDRLLRPTLDRTEPPSYDALVERYHIKTPAQAANLLITGKRMFARVLRSVIADYAGDDEAQIQNEMDDLMQILARQGTG